MTNNQVRIVEVAARDGLQNEKNFISTHDKIQLINLISQAGFHHIEATSFVSPKAIPQLADGAEVMAGISRNPNARYSALVPNMKGFEAAISAKLDEVAIFSAASQSFSKRNINCSIEESFERFIPIISAAKAVNIPVRGYISCVIACPYEGEIAPKIVAKLARQLIDFGCYEISLGDTIGVGTPASIAAMLEATLSLIPAEKLAGHYHDTNGQALNSVQVSLDKGLRIFDSSLGGLGGCPYADGATGNLASEKLYHYLKAKGFETDLDHDALQIASTFATSLKTPNA